MAKNGGLIVILSLLLIFGGIINLSDSNSNGGTPQCSDGIDNDGDGNNDSSDGNCLFAVSAEPPTPPTFYYCPNHNDEAVSPTSNEGCQLV